MIHETIVCSWGADRTPHLAPMGVEEEGDVLVIAPFSPSRTLEHILQTGYAVVNFTDDVRVFAGCLTGRRDWPLIAADCVPGWRLLDALAHAEVELQTIVEDPVRPRLRCRVMNRVTHAAFRGFNRAQMAVLEAAILASRTHLLPREKITADLAYLSVAVEKTAGPHEREAWRWLMEQLEGAGI